jgi:DNA/RNA-binding domain of Phe-tRNA-synthetase-like protein
MKKFIIDLDVFNVLPDLNAGVLVLKNVQENKKMSFIQDKEIKELLNNANKEAFKYVPNETISENEVVKVWRDTYSKFPTKKGARCSLENLLKRVLHGNPVGSILPSVDITNAISLKYAFPIGAEDVDKLEGDLHLGIMKGNEKFIPIGSEEEEPPYEGEIAYRDNYGAVCRCLNWRDGIRTEITDDTNYEFIVMECVEPDRLEELKKALDDLANLMCSYLDAEIFIRDILNKNNNEIVIQ